MRTRYYSELIQLPTFEERFEYLKIGGAIGAATFGGSRHLNQAFYNSKLWRSTRDFVIVRDAGCDLGDLDRQIYDKIVVHHMNPITEEDVLTHSDFLLAPEFLICTTELTHNAIHFGDASLLVQLPVERRPNDTSPWRL